MRRRTKRVTPAQLAKLVNEHLNERELGKAHYMRSDELLEEIVKSTSLNNPIPLANGQTAEIVDLFAEQMKVFRAHGISRYEVKVKKTAPCATPEASAP